MMHAPGASGRTSGKVLKPLEILMFSAWAPFGRGKRFTQKETVATNASKTLENETKPAIPQGWEGNG